MNIQDVNNNTQLQFDLEEDILDEVKTEDGFILDLKEEISEELNVDIISIEEVEQKDEEVFLLTVDGKGKYEYNIISKELVLKEKAEHQKLKYTAEEKEQVAEENMALIHYVLKKLNIAGIPYDELFSAGQMGYAKALANYDKSRAVKFSTYAINCIRNEILFFVRKEKKHLDNDVSLNKILSTDKDGNNLQLEEIVADERLGTRSLEEIVLSQENRSMLLNALQYLKEEEQFIIIYRYGLDRGIILTQKEIANKVGMSQANVSKIQKNCLQKLKLILRKEIY